MGQPTSGQVHLDAILTNVSVAYIQEESAFVAPKVFPLVSVEKETDRYYVFRKEDWFRDEAQRRGDSEESAGGGYSLSTDSYACDLWAFHKDLGRKVYANTDRPLDPDREAALFVTRKILLRQEIQWVTDFFVGGIWGTTMTGVAGVPGAGQFRQWNDFAASDPIEDVEAGKEAILSSTGFEPNTLTLSYPVYRKLRRHPDFRDQIKYTTADNVTVEIMARIFDIERVLVAKAVRSTAKEGAAAQTYGFTHGSHALLTYSPRAAGINTPSAGYIFAWQGVAGVMGTSVAVSRFFMDEKKAWRIEAEAAWDNKLVATDLGYFFATAVA